MSAKPNRQPVIVDNMLCGEIAAVDHDAGSFQLKVQLDRKIHGPYAGEIDLDLQWASLEQLELLLNTVKSAIETVVKQEWEEQERLSREEHEIAIWGID